MLLSADRRSPAPARPPRVLIADDDPVTRHMVRALLLAEGYEVHEAATGRAAIATFEAVRPDLVLLDVQMPEGDGFEACEAMRALDPEERVPILMLTARHDLDAIERAFRLRASDFLSKPIRYPLLRQRARFALRSRALDREVQQSRQRQTVALRMARLLFWEWEPDTDVLRWSGPLLPLEAGALTPPESVAALGALLAPEDGHRVAAALSAALRDDQPFDLDCGLRVGETSATVRLLGARAATDREQRLVSGAWQDVTGVRRTEAQAEYLAMHDELTGLDNRRAFTRQLQALLSQDAPAGVLLVGWLDLTRLQRLNEAFGQSVVNLLLSRVGRRLRALVDAPNLVGRMGGDEFAVVLHGTSAEWVRLQFEALVVHLEEPLVAPGGEVPLVWSAGYTVVPVEDEEVDAATLLDEAEAAQRSARASGRRLDAAAGDVGRPGRAAILVSREHALRRALADDRFRIVVQPQVDLQTRCVVGVETLLRWRDASEVEVSPVDFVPILEETDLIIEVGAWCLQQACHWQQRWREAGHDLRVAVNLSPRQFNDPRLLDRVAAALSEARVPSGRLELELTESLAMQRPEYAAEVLAALRALGAKVAIDDFGVGYSSLSRLVEFPIDTIKLDRAFTTTLVSSRPVEAIMRAAVGIAQGLGLTTIAEGVETRPQAELVAAIGVTEVQGYYYARPMRPEALDEFLRVFESRELARAG